MPRWYVSTIALIFGLPILLTSAALADAPQDIIGVYFDQGGTITNTSTTTLNEQVAGYLIIQNASDHSGIKGYTGSFAFAPFTPIYQFNTAVCGLAMVPPDVFLSCSPAILWSSSIVIGQLTISVPSPSDAVSIFVKPTLEGGQGPEYWNPLYNHVSLTPSSGSFDLPVATVNSGPPIEVHSSTWGSLKCLYR